MKETKSDKHTSISPLSGQDTNILFTGNIQIVGQSQAPIGSFATAFTLS